VQRTKSHISLREHPSAPLVFSWVRVTRSLVLCACFVDRCLSIALSVLRLADSDYPFGIFKLYHVCIKQCSVRLYLQLFGGKFMSYLPYLCLVVYSGVQHFSFFFSGLFNFDCPFGIL